MLIKGRLTKGRLTKGSLITSSLITSKWRAVVGVALAGLVAVPALAACASGGQAHASASASPTAMSDARLQVLVNDLVQCVREHGAPGMPDVKVQNGRVIVPNENSVDAATRQNVDAALQACKSVQDRIPASALGDSGGSGSGGGRRPTAADVPKLRQFARCIRENGVPEWPDPKADGTFPLQGSPIESEGKSPRVVAALQACRKYWSEGLSFS